MNPRTTHLSISPGPGVVRLDAERHLAVAPTVGATGASDSDLRAAFPGSPTIHRRLSRQSGFSMLIVSVFLSGWMGPAAAQPANSLFDQYELVTDSTTRQTVLTGFLLDGAVAELAIVNIDERGDRRLRIYAFANGDWEPSLDVTLRPGVLFVDVANINGHDRLITYERGRLNWFDPESASERELMAMSSSFEPPRAEEIPHVDITRDLSDDHREDLVVPNVNGFQVFMQTADGVFASPVTIGPSTDLSRIYGADGYRYDPWGQSRIHEMDYNHDGRGDLVFWNEDHSTASGWISSSTEMKRAATPMNPTPSADSG